MALIQQFDYFKPKTLNQALKLKADLGAEAQWLAGGTDLINNLDDEAVSPKTIIDIKGIKELGGLEFKEKKLWIGALVTFSDLVESTLVKRKFPLLWEAAGEVASISVRNRATMIGNLCSCVPCLDSGPPLVLYEATVVTGSPKAKREIPIDEFLKGPRQTALAPDEVVLGVTLPELPQPRGESFVKLKRYRGEDLAQASVGVIALPNKRYRIAFGSVNPTPTRASEIEQALKGKAITTKNLKTAKKIVKKIVAPLTDIRASKEYRLLMCEVMMERALMAAASRRAGKGPKYGTHLI